MRSSQQSRVCGYCFTINNYTAEDAANLITLDYQYLVYGFEVGADGTRHIQGYIHYKQNQRFSKAKKDLPRAHIECRKGSPQQAADYCKKDGNFIEDGTLPLPKGEASKQTWTTILQKAKLGEYEWIQDNYPKVWINLSNRLESLRSPKTVVLEGDLTHEWWVGETGTGKSRLLWELYPNHYQKDTNKWWCGYKDQPIVAIEEWSPKNECTGSQLKIWADRYPFSGQIKGGTLQRIRPEKIIILSNYEIEDCFTDSKDRDPLMRRFTVLRFPEDIAKAKARIPPPSMTIDEVDREEAHCLIRQHESSGTLESTDRQSECTSAEVCNFLDLHDIDLCSTAPIQWPDAMDFEWSALT